MTRSVPITVAYGDGIGPEIMKATLHIMQAAGAALDLDTVEIGEKVYLAGNTAGIEPRAWDSLRQTKVFFKAPIMTPQGGGFKSLNVTVRKTLGLYANVRPNVAYHPFVETRHPNMDLVIIRENEEDLYAGIEHRQSDEVYQCLKLISRPGSEKIIRYAFEYARAHNRKKVSCFTKDNIMKMTDGLFHKVFDEIAVEYPDIANDHWIVDIGMARVADTPERFDVIVLPNLYGDILSDITAQLAGSVGLAGSANIGEKIAMFEAIHGTAPDIAGRDIANPSGLLQAGVMMLVHIGMPEVATRIHNAWLCTLEEGIHTSDIYREGVSKQCVGTTAFAEAVIARLGSEPKGFRPVSYSAVTEVHAEAIPAPRQQPAANRELVGLDIFLDHEPRNPAQLGAALSKAGNGGGIELLMITNRGVKVWPKGFDETFCTDHWRCRFMGKGKPVTQHDLLALQQRVIDAGFEVIKTEGLYNFDGVPGYSMGQGQ